MEQIAMPLPSEVLTVQSKFSYTVRSDGTEELTIRVDSEEELEELMNVWRPIITEKDNVVSFRR